MSDSLLRQVVVHSDVVFPELKKIDYNGEMYFLVNSSNVEQFVWSECRQAIFALPVGRVALKWLGPLKQIIDRTIRMLEK
jgi:hypothetical protein